jgi:hypothetical protein
MALEQARGRDRVEWRIKPCGEKGCSEVYRWIVSLRCSARAVAKSLEGVAGVGVGVCRVSACVRSAGQMEVSLPLLLLGSLGGAVRAIANATSACFSAAVGREHPCRSAGISTSVPNAARSTDILGVTPACTSR